MLGCELPIQGEIDPVGAFVRRSGSVDRDARPGDRLGHRIGQVPDPIIRLLPADIDGQKIRGPLPCPGYGPVDGPGHVLDVDQRPPGSAVAEDRDLARRHRAGDKTFKVYIDGFDQTPLLGGKGPGARHNIYYFDDNANFNAMRWRDWKIHFAWQMQGWGGPREALNFPRIVNLRSDPYETSIDSGLYARFFADQLWLFVPTQQEVGKWLSTFREFPPRQPTARRLVTMKTADW